MGEIEQADLLGLSDDRTPPAPAEGLADIFAVAPAAQHPINHPTDAPSPSLRLEHATDALAERLPPAIAGNGSVGASATDLLLPGTRPPSSLQYTNMHELNLIEVFRDTD